MKIPYAKIEKVVAAYHSGRITDDLMRQYENLYHKSIEEIMSDFERLLHQRKYRISEMIITDLRKLIKNADKLSSIEKQTYVEANDNQDFTHIINMAQKRVFEFDSDKEARSARGAVRKYENHLLAMQRNAIAFKDMDKKGLGEYTPDTNSFTSDYFTLYQYRHELSGIYARMVYEFSENPRDVHTMPETGLELEWFFVSSSNEQIIIQRSKKKKPSCVITDSVILDQTQIITMYDLYVNVKHGYKISQYTIPEAKFWLGIFKLLRISAR